MHVCIVYTMCVQWRTHITYPYRSSKSGTSQQSCKTLLFPALHWLDFLPLSLVPSLPFSTLLWIVKKSPLLSLLLTRFFLHAITSSSHFLVWLLFLLMWPYLHCYIFIQNNIQMFIFSTVLTLTGNGNSPFPLFKLHFFVS